MVTHPNPASPKDEKSALRNKLKFIRDSVDSGLAETASLGVWNILQDRPEFQRAKGVGAFASIPHEINTYPILEGTLSTGKKLFLPKVNKEKSYFDFYPVTDLKNLKLGPFGIQGTHLTQGRRLGGNGLGSGSRPGF